MAEGQQAIKERDRMERYKAAQFPKGFVHDIGLTRPETQLITLVSSVRWLLCLTVSLVQELNCFCNLAGGRQCDCWFVFR